MRRIWKIVLLGSCVYLWMYLTKKEEEKVVYILPSTPDDDMKISQIF